MCFQKIINRVELFLKGSSHFSYPNIISLDNIPLRLYLDNAVLFVSQYTNNRKKNTRRKCEVISI